MAEYTGRTLSHKGKEIRFPDEIGDVVEWNDSVLVRLKTAGKDPFDEKVDSRNIWKIDKSGSIEWKIERADMISGEYDPFTGLWKENANIWAYNFNGLAYEVDPETGRLGETRQMK